MNISEHGKPGEEWICTRSNGQIDIWRVLTPEEISELGKNGKRATHVSQTDQHGRVAVYERFYNVHFIGEGCNSYFTAHSKDAWQRVSNGFQILDEQMEELGLTGSFGLRSQGKFERVKELVIAGKTWEEIGSDIGWAPDAAKQFYNEESMEEVN